jgi:hypothetical protein
MYGTPAANLLHTVSQRKKKEARIMTVRKVVLLPWQVRENLRRRLRDAAKLSVPS